MKQYIKKLNFLLEKIVKEFKEIEYSETELNKIIYNDKNYVTAGTTSYIKDAPFVKIFVDRENSKKGGYVTFVVIWYDKDMKISTTDYKYNARVVQVKHFDELYEFLNHYNIVVASKRELWKIFKEFDLEEK